MAERGCHKIHPREVICVRAQHHITKAIAEVVRSYAVTEVETLSVVHQVSSEVIAEYAKLCIRDELHPDDPNKPGGIE